MSILKILASTEQMAAILVLSLGPAAKLSVLS